MQSSCGFGLHKATCAPQVPRLAGTSSPRLLAREMRTLHSKTGSRLMLPEARCIPRLVPIVLAVLALAGVAALALWDFFPAPFPPRAHDFLGAFPLALIALAYLAHQIGRHCHPRALAKALLLVIAFLSWAVNQFRPDLPQAGLFNDAAIALFVLDVVLAMTGPPSSSPGRAGGELLDASREARLLATACAQNGATEAGTGRPARRRAE